MVKWRHTLVGRGSWTRDIRRIHEVVAPTVQPLRCRPCASLRAGDESPPARLQVLPPVLILGWVARRRSGYCSGRNCSRKRFMCERWWPWHRVYCMCWCFKDASNYYLHLWTILNDEDWRGFELMSNGDFPEGLDSSQQDLTWGEFKSTNWSAKTFDIF